MEKTGRSGAGAACLRCGAAAGQPCDPVKHAEHADGDAAQPQRRGIDRCTCGHVFTVLHETPGTECAFVGCDCPRFVPHPQPDATESISASLAKWHAHLRGCGVCVEAQSDTALCLAGAVLWKRAGLDVIPVPAARDSKHPSQLRTSELLRLAAFELLPSGSADLDAAAHEMRARADYMERLGDHDYGGATCTACGEVMP